MSEWWPENLAQARVEQRLDDALAKNASLQKRLQQLAEENEKLRHGSQDARSQLYYVKEKLSKLQIEFEEMKDLRDREKGRGDWLAGDVENMEKGFLPELELARLENERLKRAFQKIIEIGETYSGNESMPGLMAATAREVLKESE